MLYTITEGMEGGFGYGRTEEWLGTVEEVVAFVWFGIWLCFWCRYGLARPVEEAAALVWFGLWLCFLVQVQTDIEQIRTGVVQDK